MAQVKIRLTNYAMNQGPGAELTLEDHVAALLINRNVAELITDSEAKSVKRSPRNKSMSAGDRETIASKGEVVTD